MVLLLRVRSRPPALPLTPAMANNDTITRAPLHLERPPPVCCEAMIFAGLFSRVFGYAASSAERNAL